MILTKKEILKEIKLKRVKIVPYDPKAVGPASIDLTLDNKIREFVSPEIPIPVKENADYKKYSKLVKIKKGFLLQPGKMVLGITKEKIHLPNDVAGWLQSRSRYARIGLMSHSTAPFILPGVENHQILEIFNAGSHDLLLIPGEKICQLVLQRCEGSAKYKGKFKDQTLK